MAAKFWKPNLSDENKSTASAQPNLKKFLEQMFDDAQTNFQTATKSISDTVRAINFGLASLIFVLSVQSTTNQTLLTKHAGIIVTASLFGVIGIFLDIAQRVITYFIATKDMEFFPPYLQDTSQILKKEVLKAHWSRKTRMGQIQNRTFFSKIITCAVGVSFIGWVLIQEAIFK